MDRKEAILRIKDHMEHHGIGKYPHLKLKEAFDMSIAALDAPNEPLTLDELRQMDGEPVYIVFLPDATGEKLQFWALVDVDAFGDVNLTNNLDGSSPYEEAMANIEAIYRRPLEGDCEIKACAETCDECGFCDDTLAGPPEGEADGE